jgi:sugar phosphate isomerase/epimerase
MIRLALNRYYTAFDLRHARIQIDGAASPGSGGSGFAAVNVDEEEGLTAEDARRILHEYRMEVASGFFHGAFYLPGEEDRIYDAAKAKAEFAQALGQRFLFVSALVSPPERRAIAGRVRPDEPISLDDRQFDRMARLLERIARLWRDYDVELCYHPHAATYVEAPHEIERLMETTDASLVRLGPDTGHLLYGGADPVALVAHYLAGRAIHLKDARQAVLDRVRLESSTTARPAPAGCGPNWELATSTFRRCSSCFDRKHGRVGSSSKPTTHSSGPHSKAPEFRENT